MNIAFILGNGFDLSLGLETSYSNFYKYYMEIHSSTFEVERLKKEISADILNWSDLELALGKYLQNIESTVQFDEIYDDITQELSNYLTDVEKKFDFEKLDFLFLNKYLSAPENYFRNAEIEELTVYKNKWSNVDWKVDVITFNYTKSFENIYNNDFKGAVIGSHHINTMILNDVHHVHGYTNSRMILGVNDFSQLKNELFHSNAEVHETFIKPSFNKALKHQVDKQCFDIIKSANLICIFGSSLGETDLIWWEEIGKTISNGAKLLIFHFENKFLTDNKILRTESQIKTRFLERANLSEEFVSNIYVSVNSDIFSFE